MIQRFGGDTIFNTAHEKSGAFSKTIHAHCSVLQSFKQTYTVLNTPSYCYKKNIAQEVRKNQLQTIKIKIGIPLYFFVRIYAPLSLPHALFLAA